VARFFLYAFLFGGIQFAFRLVFEHAPALSSAMYALLSGLIFGLSMTVAERRRKSWR
jgi:hypothetical protein